MSLGQANGKAEGNGGAGANFTTSSSTTTASGSGFIVAAQIENTVSFSATAITDSKSNTYTQIGSTISQTGQKSAWFVCDNGTGGSSHTWTVNTTGTNYITAYVVEITTTNGAGITLAQNTGKQDASSPFTSGSITTTTADAMLVAFLAGNSGSNPATHAESTGFTIRADQTNGPADWSGALATFLKSATGTYDSSWTETGAVDSVAFIAAFTEDAAAVTLTQARFRWRNDDGSETTATWAAAENTNITSPLG